MRAQWRFAEIREHTIQAIQRNGCRRGDLNADRLSVLPVINHEQTVSRRNCLRTLFSRLMRQVQVHRKRLAFSVRDLKGSLSHSETKHALERVAAGGPMPGDFEVRSVVPIGQAIDDLILLAECSLEGEWAT